MTETDEIPIPPQAYLQFKELFPQVVAGHESLAAACHSTGPLDGATRNLVKMAVAAGAGLESAVKAHVRRAMAEGATREQLHHVALLCTTTVGFPRAVAVYRWIEDQLARS